MLSSPISMLFKEGFTIEVALRFFSLFAVILVIFPIHEGAHALAAKLLGDDTAQQQGRLTLNPFSHLDPMGTLCMFLFPFGWAKPVPVNPRNSTRKITMRGFMSLTAAAGPVSNVVLSLIFVIIAKVIFVSIVPAEPKLILPDHQYAILSEYSLMSRFYILTLVENFEHLIAAYAGYICMMISTISVYLAVFNLIPMPPLDGSKILYFFLGNKQVFWIERNMHIIRIALLVLVFSGLLSFILNPLADVIMTGLDYATYFISK